MGQSYKKVGKHCFKVLCQMIELAETGIDVFFFCSLLIVGAYDVINDILFLQCTNGTKFFFPCVL